MKPFLVAAALACCLSLPGAAAAQGRPCGDRATIIDRLQTRFGETRTAAGLAGNNGVVEIFASQETGSWTILITLPDGRSCLVAAGEGWEEGPHMLLKSGQPA